MAAVPTVRMSSGAPATGNAPIPMPEMTTRPIIGYPQLATYMGLIPEVAIFRRFGALNAQNLLYLQAELVRLERLLREKERADSQSNVGRKSEYAVNWYWLSQSARDGDREQLNLFLKIRRKLREYSRPGRRVFVELELTRG